MAEHRDSLKGDTKIDDVRNQGLKPSQEGQQKQRESRLQENATQRNNVAKQKQSANERWAIGMDLISKRINFAQDFSEFSTAFNGIAIQEDEHEIPVKVQLTKSQSKQETHLMQNSSAAQEMEHLNQTPFFGNESTAIKQSKQKESVVSKIAESIFGKSKEASQQFDENFNRLYIPSSPQNMIISLSERIIKKTIDAIKDLNHSLNEKQVEKHEKETHEIINPEPSSFKHLEQDNQFMTEEFSSNQKLEEVKKYVNDMKSETVEQYIRENQIREKNALNSVQKIQKAIQKYSMKVSFQKIKESRANVVTPLKENQEGDRAGSALISQRISSAQSQRLKSAISKNSQNDESFNLDLTVKTRNSKNPYQIGKMDSLMYSAESGFNFHPESPNKNRKGEEHSNSSKSVRQKMDDINEQEAEGRKSNLQKSHSQRVEHQRIEKMPKRTTSSKEKIDEHQFESQKEKKEQNEKPIIDQKGEGSYEAYQQQELEGKSSFVRPKYRQYSQDQENEKEIEKSKQIEEVKKQVHEGPHKKHKSIENKSKKGKKTEINEIEDEKSVKAQTIINRVQNFDADDEDEDEKELHESANFAKRKHTEQLVRKRVETEAPNVKKELKSQNYSIKNIKRFNKVDFSKHEELSNRSNSRVNSNQNSNSNIFTTEIDNYHKKIAKLKEEKQLKKKNLQKQLARVNYEIKMLNEKEEELSPQNKNNYASRVKISDNNEAQRKAQSLVKNLRSQKRNRNIAKLGQFSNLDKNINDYMEELNKLRSQNEEKLKQKKKLEILERMKQNQVRKLNQKKKITENQHFVLQLKGVSGPLGNAQSSNPKHETDRIDNVSKRSPTKQEEEVTSPNQSNMTPQLSQKKAYLNKIRSFSVKKSAKDAYEQILS